MVFHEEDIYDNDADCIMDFNDELLAGAVTVSTVHIILPIVSVLIQFLTACHSSLTTDEAVTECCRDVMFLLVSL